jgi:hypothetical protein
MQGSSNSGNIAQARNPHTRNFGTSIHLHALPTWIHAPLLL